MHREQRPSLEMTAGDDDSFVVTIRGVNLSAADFFRIVLDRPNGRLPKEGIDIGQLSNGRFLIKFSSAANDLVEGQRQRVDVRWSIGGDVLTSRNHFVINVKAAL